MAKTVNKARVVGPKATTREQWLNAFADAARPKFAELGETLPKEIRMSVGFPSKGARSKTIGECHHAKGSKDKHFEIFLRPNLQDDSRRIAGVLVHELVHAAGHWDHKAGFRKCATGLGLEGAMTATTEGEVFYAWADPIIEQLGPFPGASLGDSVLVGGKKKQGTRMLKVECDDCGWTFRATQSRVDEMTDHTCLACGEGQLGVQ